MSKFVIRRRRRQTTAGHPIIPKAIEHHRAWKPLAQRALRVTRGQRWGAAERRRAQFRLDRNPRWTQPEYDDLVLACDRALVAVDVECNMLKRALAQRNLAAVECAAYAVASAWLLAESGAMQVVGMRPGIAACRQFARRAIIACSTVVTAQFGYALAETLRWALLDPRPADLGRVRAVLGQLSARVDIRSGNASAAEVWPGHMEHASAAGARTALAAWRPR